MACPKATRGRKRRRINWLLSHPNWAVARRSKALRRHLDHHGYVTPNFTWAEMADTRGVPVPQELRPNTIRHCWNLERFSYALAAASRHGHEKRIAISIDGPYRTEGHNREIHGAVDSQHVHADASDHFAAQVARWARETGLTERQIIDIAGRYFTAIGNENSGTLHFDSRPGKAGSVRFVTWQGAR